MSNWGMICIGVLLTVWFGTSANEDRRSSKVYKSLKKALKTPTTIQYLDLSNQNLAEIPKEIGLLTNLKRLDISQNQLVSLPHEFTNLKNLEELKIGDNCFINFPEEVTSLVNLKMLDASITSSKLVKNYFEQELTCNATDYKEVGLAPILRFYLKKGVPQ